MPEESKTCELSSHLSIIDQILQIPQQIIALHHTEGLVDLVLHNISKKDCLSLKRVAYLVDNPDFNHLQGVAGFCSAVETKSTCSEDFSSAIEEIKNLDYNRKVKNISQESLRAKNVDLTSPENLKNLCESLEISNPKVYSWDLKHNNCGILIVENDESDCCTWKNALVEKISKFLGMCAL